MVDRAEFLKRAAEAERMAEKLPPGFEQDELKRRARALYETAELLALQQHRADKAETSKD